MRTWCNPPSRLAALSLFSFIHGPRQPAHPAPNYQTNEPSRRRQMRKNSLWRGPFIQIPPDSEESLIPFLSLRARGKKKSGKKKGNHIRHFAGFQMTRSIAPTLMSLRSELTYPRWRIQVELRKKMLSNKPCSNQNIEAKPISVFMSLCSSVPLCMANAIPDQAI